MWIPNSYHHSHILSLYNSVNIQCFRPRQAFLYPPFPPWGLNITNSRTLLITNNRSLRPHDPVEPTYLYPHLRNCVYLTLPLVLLLEAWLFNQDHVILPTVLPSFTPLRFTLLRETLFNKGALHVPVWVSGLPSLHVTLGEVILLYLFVVWLQDAWKVSWSHPSPHLSLHFIISSFFSFLLLLLLLLYLLSIVGILWKILCSDHELNFDILLKAY